MASYNKRGYKQPKQNVEGELVEKVILDEKDSETAETLGRLNRMASATTNWFSKNSKKVIIGVSVLAIVAVGVIAYQNLIVEPKEEVAANEMYQAQQYYADALKTKEDKKADELYNLALEGSEGKLGFLAILADYKGTDAANLSNYYAGICYLNLKQYQKAIEYLEKFDSDDLIVKSNSLGAIADSFSELKQYPEALEYYNKALKNSTNDFTTPRFSFKGGLVALELGKKDEALKLFKDIKENYPKSVQAANIDQYIGLSTK